MPQLLPKFFVAVLGASGSAFAESSLGSVQDWVGPVVGAVTDHSARIWAYAGPGGSARLVFWPIDRPEDLRELATEADPSRRDTLWFELEELEAATTYRYAVVLAAGSPRVRGRFTTAPPQGRAGRFRLATASCMNPEDNPSLFYLALAQQPQFLLLLGDNVYADSTHPELQFACHLEMRRVEEFAGLVRNVPTLAMWDDHDFGPNDSDGTAAGKEGSLASFRAVWPNPPSLGDPEADPLGAAFRYSYGDVDFFVLDGRYHRSPNSDPDSPEKTMLGEAQYRWLVESLAASHAPFKLIASGSTWDASRSDGWFCFATERERLLRELGEREICGMIYLSGDLHRSEIQVHPTADLLGYALPEVISSGITRGDPRSFATLDFDTTRDDPMLTVRILQEDNTIARELTLYASSLAPNS